MFRKSNTALQRKSFSLTRSQIIEDIEAISSSAEHRNKLFLSLDDKVPQDEKYAEMEAFLKGAHKLEEISQTLKMQIEKLQSLAEGLKLSVNEIECKIEDCQA